MHFTVSVIRENDAREKKNKRTIYNLINCFDRCQISNVYTSFAFISSYDGCVKMNQPNKKRNFQLIFFFFWMDHVNGIYFNSIEFRAVNQLLFIFVFRLISMKSKLTYEPQRHLISILNRTTSLLHFIERKKKIKFCSKTEKKQKKNLKWFSCCCWANIDRMVSA